MFKRNLLVGTLIVFFLTTLSACATAKQTQDDLPKLSWENICAVSVCRGTGHDGVFSVEFSPNGEQILTHVRHPDESGLYLVGLDGKANFLTAGHSAAWLPDNKHIIFLHKQNLWKMDIQTRDTTQLTSDPLDIRAPKPSPDGKLIVFASSRGGHQDLWVVPADGSRSPAQLTHKSLPADEMRFGFNWSPNGTHIAYVSNSAGYWSDDLWIIDVNTKQAQRVTDQVMVQGEPAWSPDSNKIAVFGTKKSDYWYLEMANIFLVDVTTATTTLLPKQITAREYGAPVWSHDGRHLFFTHQSRGEVELWHVNSKGGVATRMSHQGGLIHDWDISEKSQYTAIVRSTPTRGREIELYNLFGGNPVRLTQFSTNWKGLVEPKEISYRSVDGMYIQGFMFVPPDFDNTLQYPSIVQVHGGGTNSYYNGLNLVEQRLAQRGYVVIAVNYRGGSGFGREFQDLSTNDWANTQALDAAAAADFIRAQPWSNGKVGIYGYSYGGITSLGAIARAPEAFDAAVPMAGIYDFATAYKNRNRVIKLFIKHGHSGLPEEQPEHYKISNTIRLLDKVKTPVLLMHGESDTIAPFSQFEMATAELKKQDKVFEAVSYPGEPHRFKNKVNRIDMYRRMESWMDHWLKGEKLRY